VIRHHRKAAPEVKGLAVIELALGVAAAAHATSVLL